MTTYQKKVSLALTFHHLSNEELSLALFEVYQPGEDAVLTFLLRLEPQLLSYIDIYFLQRSTL